LALTWLMPRLPRFTVLHPHVRVLVLTEIALPRIVVCDRWRNSLWTGC